MVDTVGSIFAIILRVKYGTDVCELNPQYHNQYESNKLALKFTNP